MIEGWEEKKLGDVIAIKYGKDHKHLADGTIPCYGSGGIMRYVDKELSDEPSILIPRKGSLNNIFYTNFPFWTVDTLFWSEIDTSQIDTKFLFYQLSQIDFTKLNVGSAVPSLTVPVLEEVTIKSPLLPEQKAIAEILSSLDDKIDLLHRENATLEALAETLFRQTFIEEAQDDWEEGELADYANNIKETVRPENIDISLPYIALEHIDRRNIALCNQGDAASVASNKYAFNQNDILFGKLRPYFHKVCFTPFTGICSTDILVIRPEIADKFAFVLFAFFQDAVIEYSYAGSTGTRMPRTNWDDLSEYPLLRPPEKLITKFCAIVAPMLEKIMENIEQIHTLEKLRDTLLPKLMSGAVRVEYERTDAMAEVI